MKSTIMTSCAAALTFVSLAEPAAAMPHPTPAVQPAATEATPIAVRRGFYSVGGVFYYNGHRGVVYARRGYRYYRGYWFPPAAFAAGVAAGAVVTAPVPRAPAARLSAAHVRWCYATYVSYRAADNTYQPYSGPRRQCWSPFS
jgi:hypothetical protein